MQVQMLLNPVSSHAVALDSAAHKSDQQECCMMSEATGLRMHTPAHWNHVGSSAGGAAATTGVGQAGGDVTDDHIPPKEWQRTKQENGADTTQDDRATLSTKKCGGCGMNGRAIPLDFAVDVLERQAASKQEAEWPSLEHYYYWTSFSNYTSDVSEDELLRMEKWQVSDLLKKETKKLVDSMWVSGDKVSCVFACECGKFLFERAYRYGPSPPDDFELRQDDFGQRSGSFVEETTWRESFWRRVNALNEKKGEELENRKLKRADMFACRCGECGECGGDEDWATELAQDLKQILVVHSDAGDWEVLIQVEEWDDYCGENWFVVESTWQDHDAQGYRIENDDALDRYPKEDKMTPFKVLFHVYSCASDSPSLYSDFVNVCR
jgi:hypothetical protein